MHESFPPASSEESQQQVDAPDATGAADGAAGADSYGDSPEAHDGQMRDDLALDRDRDATPSEGHAASALDLQDGRQYQYGYAMTEGAPEWPLAVAPPRADHLQPAPWTLRQTIIGTALTLGPWLIFAIGAQLVQLGAQQPTQPRKLPPSVDLVTAIVVFIVSALLEAIFLIAPLMYAARTTPSELHGVARLRAMFVALGLRRVAPRPAFGMRASGWALAAAAITGAIAVILASSVIYDGIRQALRLPLKTNADTLLAQAKYEPYTVIATLLVAVLVAPICEEIFFRGFVFPGLARGMSVWGAVVVSAVLFGLAHADIGSFVVLVVIGTVLAVVRWRTDSLWPGVIVHTLNNTLALVGILVLLPH